MTAAAQSGTIFDIQRYCVHDGPGIRTAVFLKGCPLRCTWCCNPESQGAEREVIHRSSKCTCCEKCLEACKSKAISLDNGVHIDRRVCNSCGDCISVCAPQALAIVGEVVTVEKVINEFERDSLFYRNSGGGITISGGEPLFQADFARDILLACQEKGWHTAVETSGYASSSTMEQVLKEADLVLYDLKHLDSSLHREFTGVPNEPIVENLRILDTWAIPFSVRIPVVPGVNNSGEHLRAMLQFIARLSNVQRVHLLPYHRLGASKYANLDRAYPLEGIEALKDEALGEAKEIFESQGLDVEIGG